MLIAKTIFDEIQDQHEFRRAVVSHAEEFCIDGAMLIPVVSPSRLCDAHRYWMADIKRLSLSLPNGNSPDHFKQAAHLTYWLRRQGPVIDYRETNSIQDGGGDTPSPTQKECRDLLFEYGSEYLAFDIGYQICKYFESHKVSAMDVQFDLGEEYIRTISCFLKEKNVSPHALFLVFKSLFYKRY